MPDLPTLRGVEIDLCTRCRVLGPLEEPDDHLDGYAGVILGVFWSDEAAESSELLGTIAASVVRIGQAQDAGLPLSEVFDAEEDLANEFYPALVGTDDEIRRELIEMPGDVLILERLRVDPAWQKRGIGLAALGETIRVLGRGCSLISTPNARAIRAHVTADGFRAPCSSRQIIPALTPETAANSACESPSASRSRRTAAMSKRISSSWSSTT